MDRQQKQGNSQTDQQQQELAQSKQSVISSTVSSSVCSRKRWSITSIHSSSSNGTTNFRLTAKRQSLAQSRNSSQDNNNSRAKLSLISAQSSSGSGGDLGSLAECRLGAQSAPALLSNRVHYNNNNNNINYNSGITLTNCDPIIMTNLKHKQSYDDPEQTEPIVQLKESSSSSQSSSSTSSQSDSDSETGTRANQDNKQLVNKPINSDENSAESETGSGSRQVSSSRTSSRIVKRRLIRTRQTKQQKITSNSAEENLEEINQSATQANTNCGEPNKVNTFFRTRQIGGYQTSSSKTSIKTHTSKSSHKVTSSSKSSSSNETNNLDINNSTLSTSSSHTLSKSASKRHIAERHEEEGSSGKMLNNLSAMTLPNSTRASPDLSQSSFPFEIERVQMASPDNMQSGSFSSNQSQVTEAAVSHRESFSTSTRANHISSSSSAATSATASASQNQFVDLNRHQEMQQLQQHKLLATSNSLTSNSSMASTVKAAADHRVSAASSTISSSSAASQQSFNQQINRSEQQQHQQHQRGRLFSSSSSQHSMSHQEMSSSATRFHLKAATNAPSATIDNSNPFQIFVTSPDVRSLAQEIGTDFAKLESCLNRADIASQYHHNHHNHNLIGGFHHHKLFQQPFLAPDTSAPINMDRSSFSKPLSLPEASLGLENLQSNSNGDSIGRTNRIRELLNKANNPNFSSQTATTTQPPIDTLNDAKLRSKLEDHELDKQQKRSSQAMNESITRIEHKLSDLCKKLDDCSDLKQAIELLEILIQMIEKAWSVPVCGDDLGFRLCSSFRLSGGLSFILGLIFDAQQNSSGFLSNKLDIEPKDEIAGKSKQNNRNQLRLSLPNQHAFEETITLPAPESAANSNLNSPTATHTIHEKNPTSFTAKDSDSEILTSDLGLDSASVESFSYANTSSQINQSHIGNNTEQHLTTIEQNQEEKDLSSTDAAATSIEHLGSRADENNEQNAADCTSGQTLQRDELIFLSARLLSQCLTTDNRDFLVSEGWLEPVVKLACRLAMIKSGQSHRKLLLGSSKCVLTRQSSTVNAAQLARLKAKALKKESDQEEASCGNENDEDSNGSSNLQISDDSPIEDSQADLLASIGTEILQHLFKHSEDTCTTIIGMGGLEAILFGCRSSAVETLRHCAPALANLALHGGCSAHELMIEHKAHVWLFPLAFNEDDNVQYYACLAIVTLVANQEIEADVLKSSTLNLVEPFVTSHEPKQFAESNTAHIHGQSASWLRRLIPLLSSKREEARNLAAFHLAMEAYVKREQAQVHIFRDIQAIEPLKKLAGSPNAIASKFACQALRLIGEQVPHRLSQQVALWTNEDVIQWVCQVGFAQYEREFADSGVDGDLLLQLDELMLERDIGIRNGITRRRFLRELAQLKKISDYSSLDRTNLCSLLGPENLQYAYPMLKFGVTRENICHLDAENLLEECGIPNTIHRKILSQTIRNLQDKMALQAQAAADLAQSESAAGVLSSPQKTLDVFVSYRRSTGSQLASLLKVHLQLRNFSVFIDVERLEAGKFDNNLLDSIKQARNFILVLSPNALDRCIDDFECKDWVHKEIVAALSSDCNIIPIMDNFSFPDPEKLPEDMRSILYYNGVPWIHDYQDACVDKIERFIRGEVNKAVTINNNHHNNNQNNNQLISSACSTSTIPINCANSAHQSNNQTSSSQQSNCGSLKRHFNQFALSPTPSSLGNQPITPLMSQHLYQQQYSDYSHPLASAISQNQYQYNNNAYNPMNNQINNCQQQANLLHQVTNQNLTKR